ncbi:MAG: hypothetical protein KAJ91_02645 [Candidatus Aenigmarchaeota archaeon]|nr:hypothetical protein [Candidatus Aenigmarchaeota archaeon]
MAYTLLFLAPMALEATIPETPIPDGYNVAKATFLPNGDTVAEYVPGEGFAFAEVYQNGSFHSVVGGGSLELIQYIIEN